MEPIAPESVVSWPGEGFKKARGIYCVFVQYPEKEAKSSDRGIEFFEDFRARFVAPAPQENALRRSRI